MNDESVWRFLLLSHIYLSICTSSTESVNELVSKCTWLEFCFPIGGKGTCNFKWFTSRLKLCGKFLSMLANQFFRIWAELVFFISLSNFFGFFICATGSENIAWWYECLDICSNLVRMYKMWDGCKHVLVSGGDEEYHNLL